MGKLVRGAGEEADYSQRKLAELIYRRQAALSDMENGKMEPDASTLLLLAFNLKKSLSYFFPAPWLNNIEAGLLTEIEQELLIQARRITPDDLQKIIIQIKAVAEKFGPHEQG